MAGRRAYEIGPILAPGERPWPGGWEQDARVRNGHRHEWENVLLAADGRSRVRIEEVVRCAVCHAPRCGHSTDDKPCILVRHHREPHEQGGLPPPHRR